MKIITTTDGVEFKLFRHRMEEINSNPYMAKRKDIRAAFRGKETVSVGIFDLCKNSLMDYPVRKERGIIHIGCKRFEGTNYKTLRQWALGK